MPCVVHGVKFTCKAGGIGKTKQGGPLEPPSPGASARKAGPTLTIGKKKDTSTGGGRSGPISIPADSRPKSTQQVGGPSGIKKLIDTHRPTITQTELAQDGQVSMAPQLMDSDHPPTVSNGVPPNILGGTGQPPNCFEESPMEVIQDASI